MRVLCFGSLNIDKRYLVDHFVKKGETQSSESLRVFGGGKGLNQSIAMARAGIPTWHAGAIGTDGKFLLELLEETGVNTQHIVVLDDVKTGHAIIQNDRDGDNCILLYGGANQAITREQVDRVIGEFRENEMIVLQNEINELDYIIRKAHEKGLKIILNPSPMNQKILELPLEYVDYFILNEIEAGQILGIELEQDFEWVNVAKRLVARFPRAAVVLTLGDMGSLYVDANTTIHQSAYKVEAVDTTAAGDTFTGYFIAGILNHQDIQEVMDRASKAAAIAVTRPGAAPAIPSYREVERFGKNE